jgi:uncharacterized membrane-anchored protein YjiN (DUF445 family)
MKRNIIIQKTLLKLASVNTQKLNRLMEDIKQSKNPEFIYQKVFSFLKTEARKEEEIKVVYNRLVKELETSKPHTEAFKLILKEFPFVAE